MCLHPHMCWNVFMPWAYTWFHACRHCTDLHVCTCARPFLLSTLHTVMIVWDACIYALGIQRVNLYRLCVSGQLMYRSLLWRHCTWICSVRQLTGYTTGQPDTQPDDRLCNRMGTCACSNKVTFTNPRGRRCDGCVQRIPFCYISKRTRSAVIHQEFGERIISLLKNPLRIEDRNFRHLVKRSGFQLLDLPEAGIRDTLVVQVKENKGGFV